MKFRKRLRLAPGINVNLSGSGIGLSFGPRGASVSIGKRGTYLNTSIPGTGIYNRKKLSKKRRKQTSTERSKLSEKTEIKLSVYDDGTVTFIDTIKNEPISDAFIKQLKREKSDEIKSWLENVADNQNALRVASKDIHFKSPSLQDRPLKQRSCTIVEPTCPAEPSIGLLTRLFRWRTTRNIRLRHRQTVTQFEYDHAEWQSQCRIYRKNEQQRFDHLKQYLHTDAVTAENYFAGYLEAIEWPRETLVKFSIVNGLKTLVVDIDLPEIEDLPTTQTRVHGSQLKLITKNLSQKQLRLDYARHIHGIIFRIVSEAFACLPSVTEVVCSGYSQRRHRNTYIVGDEYLLSVRARLLDWNEIDFQYLKSLDPIDFIANLEHSRRMSTTGILKPVESLSSAYLGT